MYLLVLDPTVQSAPAMVASATVAADYVALAAHLAVASAALLFRHDTKTHRYLMGGGHVALALSLYFGPH